MIESLKSKNALEIANELPAQSLQSLLVIQKGLTMQQAVSAMITRELAQKLGQATLHKLVCAVLKLFCVSLNLSQTMNAVQVYETAGFWLENYPSESLKDLIMCLKLAKQSEYGKIYNRFDSEVFNDFWRQYLEQKAEYRENRHRDQKTAEASDEKGVLRSISEHMPETGKLIKASLLKKTPEIQPPTSHERYVQEITPKLKFASIDELKTLHKQATSVKLTDIIALIDQELAIRSEDIASQPAHDDEQAA